MMGQGGGGGGREGGRDVCVCVSQANPKVVTSTTEKERSSFSTSPLLSLALSPVSQHRNPAGSPGEMGAGGMVLLLAVLLVP